MYVVNNKNSLRKKSIYNKTPSKNEQIINLYLKQLLQMETSDQETGERQYNNRCCHVHYFGGSVFMPYFSLRSFSCSSFFLVSIFWKALKQRGGINICINNINTHFSWHCFLHVNKLTEAYWLYYSYTVQNMVTFYISIMTV